MTTAQPQHLRRPGEAVFCLLYVQVEQSNQKLPATQSLLAGRVGLDSMVLRLCNDFAFCRVFWA
jgi:hypothetical protein